ncbi:MAG TPA: alpha/beta fold hydrolase [Deferrisomatales bacterium]|nr:alpha/beta fold hydrolase [Deferrisomatales bacterium]
MSGSEPVVFPCGELSLEGCVHRPGTGASRGGAVVCHPHPEHGGTMHHPVVVALAAALTGAGFVALRFNFRGVGRSQGRHGGGGPEGQDLAAALELAAREAGPGTPLVLAGYSFGAWVAYPMACADPRVRAVLCVAPPLALLPMPAVAPSPVARWFALGDRDEFCSPGTFREWYRAQDDPKEYLALPGADHFLAGREAEVGAAAAGFAAAHLGGELL